MILQGTGAAVALLPIQPPFFDAFASEDMVEQPYVDPQALLKVPFGTHSHEIEPWRSYAETVPARNFVNGIGFVAPGDDEIPPSILGMIAACGATNLRLEISWSKLDYRNEKQLEQRHAERLSRLLVNCKSLGLRPLILLNANQGAPTPLLQAAAQVVVDAPAGARTIVLRVNGEIIIGRTGLSNLSDGYWAAENLIIASNRDGSFSLSKPLARAIKAGETLQLATLKYEPFSVPGTPRNEATMAGWLSYVDCVAAFATDVLESARGEDKGFDLEIWNELTFGTKFLYINNYYAEKPVADYFPDSIWYEIARRTAEHVAQRGKALSGVTLVNGFASTVPWPASSEQHPRIAALAKHPYVHYLNFPADEQSNTTNLDVAGVRTTCVPSYAACFPEYAATAIQTETLVRDLAPITTRIYDKDHGRNARKIGGQVSPVGVWLTEAGLCPKGMTSVNRDAAELKMMAALRYLTFYLNKGAERVYLYDLTSGEQGYGLVGDNALGMARAGMAFEPTDDRLLSPTLRVMRRLTAVMRQGLSDDIADPRSLSFRRLVSRIGPNEASCVNNQPPDQDGLVLLPYQVNDHRFIVIYYLMSRNLLEMKPLRGHTVRVEGLRGQSIAVRSYDPINDRWSSPNVTAREETSVVCALTVSDMPQLLILEEQDNA